MVELTMQETCFSVTIGITPLYEYILIIYDYRDIVNIFMQGT